jgi:putative SOS response-associated peptidase YedK
MPVILTTLVEIDLWMDAPTEEALRLQRPLRDDALRIVACPFRGIVMTPAAAGERLFQPPFS